jgi:hypothetical protein
MTPEITPDIKIKLKGRPGRHSDVLRWITFKLPELLMKKREELGDNEQALEALNQADLSFQRFIKRKPTLKDKLPRDRLNYLESCLQETFDRQITKNLLERKSVAQKHAFNFSTIREK